MSEPTPAARPSFSTPAMVALESQIAATRAELAATVDELTNRLDPKPQASRLVAEGKQMVSDATDAQADPQARTRARVVLGVAAGVAALAVTGLVRKLAR